MSEKMSEKWHRKRPFVAEVASVERLNPGFVRVGFGIDADGQFPVDPETDRYVKIQFLPEGVEYELPFDSKQVKKEAPKELWPRQRAFTVRAWDPDAEVIYVDFVDHGATGVVGPWLRRVQVGDRMQMRGPKGDYTPRPEGHHVLIGDECVVPAVATTLKGLSGEARVDVLMEARSPEHRVRFESGASVEEQWVYREHIVAGEESPLVSLVRAASIGSDAAVFLHGEAGMVRDVRRVLIKEKGLDPKSMSVSAYWKAERDDEAWREEKPDWKKALKGDLA